MESVGWIGVGALGYAIVTRLLQSDTKVVVFNRTAHKMSVLAEKGAIIATSPREVAELSDSVFLCLTGEEATKEVLFEPTKGVVTASRKNFCVVDTSTIGPNFAVEIHNCLKQVNVRYIDCPVSGGCEGAYTGQLTAIMSGEADLVEQHRKVVSKFASSIHYVGGSGTAQLLKVLNNFAESINLWGAAEVITLGLKTGIPLETLRSVFSTMRGYSTYMNLLFERLCQPEEKTSVSLEVRVKDLRLAHTLAISHGVETPLGVLVEKLFSLAMEQQSPSSDQTECIKLLQENLKCIKLLQENLR